jgi:hypothetical protein
MRIREVLAVAATGSTPRDESDVMPTELDAMTYAP